mmetsp:Transcript_23753/g.43121  ORF Transcript_23753/g.43121 Transcript_23753/m.43121 type:complete len:104 (+) Transcript_23753:246-557(+)
MALSTAQSTFPLVTTTVCPSFARNLLVCTCSSAMTHLSHLSRRGGDVPTTTILPPPVPEILICIDCNSTCFDAYLSGDLMCKKCKNLIVANVYSNLSLVGEFG